MTCANGATRDERVARVSRSAAWNWRTAVERLRWVTATAFGRPVVPLEYGSSAMLGARRRHRGAARRQQLSADRDHVARAHAPACRGG